MEHKRRIYWEYPGHWGIIWGYQASKMTPLCNDISSETIRYVKNRHAFKMLCTIRTLAFTLALLCVFVWALFFWVKYFQWINSSKLFSSLIDLFMNQTDMVLIITSLTEHWMERLTVKNNLHFSMFITQCYSIILYDHMVISIVMVILCPEIWSLCPQAILFVTSFHPVTKLKHPILQTNIWWGQGGGASHQGGISLWSGSSWGANSTEMQGGRLMIAEHVVEKQRGTGWRMKEGWER